MKIVCAPDKFKGSLTARQAAAAMAAGAGRALPGAVIDQCPVADGGEGTVDAMLAATGGARRVTAVTGPVGEPVRAEWGTFDGADGATAVIEMAAASGLALVPRFERDPAKTTTWGTGELLMAALDAGVSRIILGIGGSATNDGGVGAAAALGVRFLDGLGSLIPAATLCGGILDQIVGIDTTWIDPRLARVRITVACDVSNPMTGPNGAASVYGPQKGATPAQVEMLDRNLRHLAELFRSELGRDVEHLPGAGAAGAMGGGLMAFLGAELSPGIAMVLDAVGFDRRVAGAALCMTGEGRLDGGSLAGKVCVGVARTAAKHDVRTVALVGATGPGVERAGEAGLAAVRVIGEGLPQEESILRAAELLEKAAERAVREFVTQNK
ncbi:MAG: glycerate kinase [Planctomycetes bacterium]|nr:glycerate kinase [Planctomycetota bacterium]